jgi:hypothetical protein
MPGEDANQLPLGFAELIVEAAEHASERKRLIILDEVCRKGGLLEAIPVEDLGKPPSFVFKAFRLQQLYVVQLGIDHMHFTRLMQLSWKTGVSYEELSVKM